MNKIKLLALAVTVPLLLGTSAFAQEDAGKSKLTSNTAKAIVETISALNIAYVDPIPQKEFEDKIISGILSKFDSHSSYLDSEELKSFTEDMSGQYAGLGMIAKRPHSPQYGVRIEELLKDGPAYTAGLKEGDTIIKVGDKELRGTLEENIKFLKGKAGTTIKVTYLRGNDKGETKVTRNFIPTKSVFSSLCECNGTNTLFLRVVGFNENTGSEAIESLKANMDKKPTAIVLDLKDNPGGMLQASLELSSLFLRKDSIVVSTKERGSDQNYLQVNKESIDADFWSKRSSLISQYPNLIDSIPLYVMINSGSASASEIVAAALKDNSRATLVGEKTFGKGSVQRMINLSNGGAIKITIARYYTPSGITIQAEGVKPHIEISDNRPWRLYLLDLQKKKYLEKTPHSFERESDLPGHLNAKYKTNTELVKEFENKISDENIYVEKVEPYEKRFSYSPLSKDGKMDSITSATISDILKKAKDVKQSVKATKENKTWLIFLLSYKSLRLLEKRRS